MTGLATVHRELSDVLAKLEEDRRRRLRTVWKIAALLAGCAAACALISLARYGAFGWGFVAAVVALVAWLVVLSHQSSRFSGDFKAQIMPELVRSLGKDLEYHPNYYLSREEFCECGLFMAPDRYTGCDFVEGHIGATHVRFSLVHAEEEYTVTETVTDTDADGNTTTRTETRTEYRDIFRGLLFSADCNKYFSGRTIVTAGGKGIFGRWSKSLVSLEDPEFSRHFTVYGSDQVEARYLLTPSLMSRIMELRSRAGRGMQLSFVNNRTFVAVPMRLGAFSPSIWRRIDDAEALSGYYGYLSFMVGLVEDLNLNTRIWSKHA